MFIETVNTETYKQHSLISGFYDKKGNRAYFPHFTNVISRQGFGRFP